MPWARCAGQGRPSSGSYASIHRTIRERNYWKFSGIYLESPTPLCLHAFPVALAPAPLCMIRQDLASVSSAEGSPRKKVFARSTGDLSTAGGEPVSLGRQAGEGEGGRGYTRFHSDRRERDEGIASPRRASSRGEMLPSGPSHSPRRKQQQPGSVGGAVEVRQSAGTATSSWPHPGVAEPTSESEGRVVRPAIPSAMCTIAGGVGATSVSPRGAVGGMVRQLAVAKQYLNHSLVVPTPPGDIDGFDRERPATTGGASTASANGGQEFAAGNGCSSGDCRPRTTPARSSRTRRDNNQAFPGTSIWSSSIPGLSSRPLTSSRVVSGGPNGTRSRRVYAPASSGCRKPIVLASPRREEVSQSPDMSAGGNCGGVVRCMAPSSSCFGLETPSSPAQSSTPPRKLRCKHPDRQREHSREAAAQSGFSEAGVERMGEVGYIISSVSTSRRDSCEKGGNNGVLKEGSGRQLAASSDGNSKPSTPPRQSTAGVEAAIAAVPTLPLHRLSRRPRTALRPSPSREGPTKTTSEAEPPKRADPAH